MNTLENPNLDGDFKALIKAQEARKAERNAQRKKRTTLSEVIIEDQNENSEAHVEAEAVQKTNEDPEVHQLRTELFEAAQNDDVTKLNRVLEKVLTMGLTLRVLALRDSDTNATVLHKACDHKARRVTAALIETQDYKFLMEDFGIMVRNITSRKTALHQLVEWGEQELIIKLLDKIPTGDDDKLQFMMKTVLTEVPGQRPRHLLAIHLAALHGHTYVVTFLVNLGVDVNATNNKNDTPILWAARGNHIETARQLMTLGANLQLQNDKGSSPLYFAVRYGFEELVTVLIKEGKADVHQQRKLGLISPIVLASALGYTSIVRTLLDNGADINLKITGGFTPLHHAAVQGNLDTVELLLERGARIEDDNDAGDNALLLAANENQIEVVEVLTKNGAKFTERNKQGMSIWDFAVESEDNELLIAAVNCYRRSHASSVSGGKLIMPPGKTPLHSAALKGDCEKIRVLKSLGVDLAAEDEGGNTLFHLAARENQSEVLEEFIGSVNVNAQNSEQETALHLAARNGHYEAITILLHKIGVGVKNSSGETALHVACRSRRALPEVIGQMVDTIVKAHNWSLVDAEDRNGDTALHVAARWGRSDIMEQLHPMNPRIRNISGETPLHVAAKEGQHEVVETMFEIFRKDININQQNRDGESVLHVAAERGDAAMVESLIGQGADLSLKDNDGDTVLHLLAIQCHEDPDNTIKYLQVFQTIVSNAVRWWCMRKDLMHPDSQSEVYEKYRRIALIRLTSQIPNNERLTVNMLAARRGAKDLMERILHIPKVYVFQKDANFIFDVTDLTHETMADTDDPVPQRSIKDKKASRVSPTDISKSKVTLSGAESAEKTSYSCLDLIVRSPNLMVANQMLDIVPVQQIVGDYWSAYQWMYGTIMIIHLIYMSLLSAFAIPLLRAENNDPEPWPYVVFLLWPCAILMFEFYYLIVSAINMCRKRDIQTKRSVRSDANILSRAFDRLMQSIIVNLAHITSVLFSSLVISWYILYLVSNATNQAHVLAVAMILGWLYTIAFTEGFESVHAFTIMLKNIIIRDMTRFLFLYLLVMFAFALAFQCLLNLVPEFEDIYPDAFSLYFITFNMMIGMGEIFDENLDNHPNATFIKILYLFYIVLTTVILLNLLIAMMTDSYAAVKAREGTTWRVGSVQLAVELEKSMPFLPKIFKFLGIKHNPLYFDHDTERWMMTVPKRAVIFNKEITRDNVIEAVSRLEKEIKEIKVQYSDVSDRLQVLMDKAYERPTSARPTSGRPRFRKSVAILQSKISDTRPSVIKHGESDLLQFQKSAQKQDLSLKL